MDLGGKVHERDLLQEDSLNDFCGMDNTMTEPYLVSPDGLLLDMNYPVYPFTGQTMASYTASSGLPGASVQVRGTGRVVLSSGQVNLSQGVIDVHFNVGAPGSKRGLVFLTSDAVPTSYLAIMMDSSNRPFAEINDALGNTIARTQPTIAPLPQGTDARAQLLFGASFPLFESQFFVFLVNSEELQPWQVGFDPTSSWATFLPALLLVGVGLAGAQDFNGTLHRVQISPVLPSIPSGKVEEEVDVVGFVGASTFVAAGLAHYAASATPTGSSSVTPTTKVHYAASASPTGSSSITATSKAHYAASATPTGAATLTATATTH
jgi:hypothetical protein